MRYPRQIPDDTGFDTVLLDRFLAEGMAAQERDAVTKALARARRDWLKRLARCRADLPDHDARLARLDAEISRLRRLLKLGPSSQALLRRRQQTRERVRRWRARKTIITEPNA
jgi:hypothetical protein